MSPHLIRVTVLEKEPGQVGAAAQRGSRTQGSQAWRAAAGAPAGEAWAPSRLPLALLCGEQDEGSGERRGPGVFWTHFGGRCSTTRVCVRERDKGGPVD